MSLPDVDIPRPSQVVIRSRLAFTEADALQLQNEIGGLPMRSGVTPAEPAKRLAQCAREYVTFHAIDHGSTSAQETAAWRDELEQVLGKLRALVTPIAADLEGAKRALLLDETAALATLSSPALIEAATTIARQARKAAAWGRAETTEARPEHNAMKPGTMVLLVALVDMLAWAFEGVERPGRRPRHHSHLFETLHCAKEMIAAAIKANPPRIEGREPDAALRAAETLHDLSQEAMASTWRRYHEWLTTEEGVIDVPPKGGQTESK